jgi:hypothetical protein
MNFLYFRRLCILIGFQSVIFTVISFEFLKAIKLLLVYS